ncbi:MAG: V-type ATP synthase subunit E family protein [Bacillota bacterium]
MSLEQILAGIRAESDRLRDEVLALARLEADEILAEARRRAERESEAILDAARKEAEEIKRRLITLANLESRRRVSSAKEQLVSRAFELALERLANMDRQRYSDYLVEMLVRVAQGTEAVRFSEKDMQSIAAQVVARANERLASLGRPAGLTVSDRTVQTVGGVILSSGKKEVNLTFESALSLIRDDLLTEVAAVLFSDNPPKERG